MQHLLSNNERNEVRESFNLVWLQRQNDWKAFLHYFICWRYIERDFILWMFTNVIVQWQSLEERVLHHILLFLFSLWRWWLNSWHYINSILFLIMNICDLEKDCEVKFYNQNYLKSVFSTDALKKYQPNLYLFPGWFNIRSQWLVHALCQCWRNSMYGRRM